METGCPEDRDVTNPVAARLSGGHGSCAPVNVCVVLGSGAWGSKFLVEAMKQGELCFRMGKIKVAKDT